MSADADPDARPERRRGIEFHLIRRAYDFRDRQPRLLQAPVDEATVRRRQHQREQAGSAVRQEPLDFLCERAGRVVHRNQIDHAFIRENVVFRRGIEDLEQIGYGCYDDQTESYKFKDTAQESSLDELRTFSAAIDEDVFEVLTLEGSVASRAHRGGTAPERVREAVRAAREHLDQVAPPGPDQPTGGAH